MRRCPSAFLALLSVSLCLSCGGGSGGSADGGPAPPPVSGGTRIGWDQAAADTTELATLRFVIYIDNVRNELPGAACSGPPGDNGFSCEATLPAMTSGQHTIQLASYLLGNVLLESAKSAPLVITVAAGGGVSAVASIADAAPSSSRVAAPSSVRDFVTSDGTSLHAAVVAAVAEPAALAVADDGTLIVGDRRGAVRIVRGGANAGDTALEGEGILDVVLAPDFARSHLMYVLDTVSAVPATFRLARYREIDGRLGERAVLLDGVPASPASPAGALAFGTDGRLYVALDDGGDAAGAARPSSYNGKVLRLSPDGRIPADQSASTPVYAGDLHAPRSLAWDGPSASLWVADAAAARVTRLRTTDRRTTAAVVRLPQDQGPSSIAVYRAALMPQFAGDLLVTSVDDAPSILRVRLTNAGTVATTEPLTLLGSGSIRLVKVAADGAIYALTDDAVVRVTPR